MKFFKKKFDRAKEAIAIITFENISDVFKTAYSWNEYLLAGKDLLQNVLYRTMEQHKAYNTLPYLYHIIITWYTIAHYSYNMANANSALRASPVMCHSMPMIL